MAVTFRGLSHDLRMNRRPQPREESERGGDERFVTDDRGGLWCHGVSHAGVPIPCVRTEELAQLRNNMTEIEIDHEFINS